MDGGILHLSDAFPNTLEVMQCILEKIELCSRAVRGNANYWHHIGVMVVAGNTGAAVANRLRLKRLQLTEVVDTRVDDDVTQFVFVALFTVTAAVIVMYVVVTSSTTVTVVNIVVHYGSR